MNAANATTSGAWRYSILIADDQADVRSSVSELVAREGFEPLVAPSGEAALEILETRPVHLFLCDMHMDRLTGLETLRLAHSITANLPCILMSADLSETLIRQAWAERVFSILSKPVSTKELVYTVRRAITRTYEPVFPGEIAS